MNEEDARFRHGYFDAVVVEVGENDLNANWKTATLCRRSSNLLHGDTGNGSARIYVQTITDTAMADALCTILYIWELQHE